MTAWYCAQTLPQKETLAFGRLIDQGFDALLPTEPKQYRTRYGRYERQRPLFPGYLFVAFDIFRDRWQSIYGTVGIRRLISTSPTNPTPVPTPLIDGVRNQVSLLFQSRQPVAEGLPIKAGTRLRIKYGHHFEGATGVCALDTVPPHQRVKLLLSIMHGDVAVTLPRDKVEVL